MAVADDDERRALESGARDSIDCGRDAGTERRQTRAWTSADLGLRDRRDRGSGLGGGEDERDAGAPRRFDDVEVAAATGHAEERADACVVEACNQQIRY